MPFSASQIIRKPFSSVDNYVTPDEYTHQARKDVQQKLEELRKKHSHPIPLKHGNSPLSTTQPITASAFDSDASSVKSDQASLNEIKKRNRSFLGHFRKHSDDHGSNLRPVVSNQSVDSGFSIPSVETCASSQTQESASVISSLFSGGLYATQTTDTNHGDLTDKPLSGVVTLQDVLPKKFDDMYSPDVLRGECFANGRPTFTSRNIIDWELNDIRSLLMITEIWNFPGNLKVPDLKVPPKLAPYKLRIQYVPLNSNDDFIVHSLVESDIYKESKFELNFRMKTADFIVQSARRRHQEFMVNNYHITRDMVETDPQAQELFFSSFFKYEMRNIIENFLLNLGVETQCRLDFKTVCSTLKKKRKRDLLCQNGHQMLSNDFLSSRSTSKNLLMKAVVNNMNDTAKSQSDKSDLSYKLTKQEKASIWQTVQAQVYENLGLDWQPDSFF